MSNEEHQSRYGLVIRELFTFQLKEATGVSNVTQSLVSISTVLNDDSIKVGMLQAFPFDGNTWRKKHIPMF
jgi:hypothetical protein